jgi:hypothetical protein
MKKRFGPLPESINGRLSQATEAEPETWGKAVLTTSTAGSGISEPLAVLSRHSASLTLNWHILPSYPNNEQVTPVTRPSKMRIRDEFRVSNFGGGRE